MAESAYDAFVISLRGASLDVVVGRLMSIKFLRRNMVCSACQRDMSLVRDNKLADGCCWRCDLPFYLKEFMWRTSYNSIAFLALITLLAILN